MCFTLIVCCSETGGELMYSSWGIVCDDMERGPNEKLPEFTVYSVLE